MEETRLETVEDKEQTQEPKSRKIEPDWTESEWFQIWLKLARRRSASEVSEFAPVH